ncbi:MAG: hypothetical protein K1X87_06120 [Dehalococcoidia bacterium]|nr:hypothetical protein [Dehalococcoidia bacterium]
MTPSALSREEQAQVMAYLEQQISGSVSLEVWTRKESPLIRTDREPCVHCEDVVSVARQVAALHPALSVTLYDLDRHERRAQEAGIDRPPTTVLRGRGGRQFRITGLWAGLLFPPTLDVMAILSAGATPLSDDTRAALASLEQDVTVEVLGAAYDAYSAHMLRLVAAFAVESKRVQASFVNVANYPLLAAARSVEEIPVVFIGNKRFVGVWDGPELAEQIRRVAGGDDTPVSRGNPMSGPFYTDEEIAALAAERLEEPPRTAGGLYLPGR